MSKSDDTAEQKRLLLAQKKEQALTHLAFLQREVLEMGASLQAAHLVEANQRLLLTLLSKQDMPETSGLAELTGSNQVIREANEKLAVSALHAQYLQNVAEQALVRQRDGLAAVAHELRNPLTPIVLLLERMADVPHDELRRMCELIKGQVQQLSRLVEDLVDVSGVGKLRIDRTTTDIVAVINSVASAYIPLMAEKNICFAAHIPPGPLWIDGDAVRVSQVLHNLLTNAAKYTRPGDRVTLAASVEDACLRISVSDGGIGISPAAIPFIFDAFVRHPLAVELNHKGLGIGLTVVRDLVQAHGGTVSASSEGEGRGSEFVVTFPLKAMKAPQ